MRSSKMRPKASQCEPEPMNTPQEPSTRRQRIAEAAYYRAERRGFAPGLEEDDWLEAEKQIDSEQRTPR